MFGNLDKRSPEERAKGDRQVADFLARRNERATTAPRPFAGLDRRGNPLVADPGPALTTALPPVTTSPAAPSRERNARGASERSPFAGI